jgi:hypothetical protein
VRRETRLQPRSHAPQGLSNSAAFFQKRVANACSRGRWPQAGERRGAKTNPLKAAEFPVFPGFLGGLARACESPAIKRLLPFSRVFIWPPQRLAASFAARHLAGAHTLGGPGFVRKTTA